MVILIKVSCSVLKSMIWLFSVFILKPQMQFPIIYGDGTTNHFSFSVIDHHSSGKLAFAGEGYNTGSGDYGKVYGIFQPSGEYYAFSIYNVGLEIYMVETENGVMNKFTITGSLSGAHITSHGIAIDDNRGIYYIYTDSGWDAYLFKLDGISGALQWRVDNPWSRSYTNGIYLYQGEIWMIGHHYVSSSDRTRLIQLQKFDLSTGSKSFGKKLVLSAQAKDAKWATLTPADNNENSGKYGGCIDSFQLMVTDRYLGTIIFTDFTYDPTIWYLTKPSIPMTCLDSFVGSDSSMKMAVRTIDSLTDTKTYLYVTSNAFTSNSAQLYLVDYVILGASQDQTLINQIYFIDDTNFFYAGNVNVNSYTQAFVSTSDSTFLCDTYSQSSHSSITMTQETIISIFDVGNNGYSSSTAFTMTTMTTSDMDQTQQTSNTHCGHLGFISMITTGINPAPITCYTDTACQVHIDLWTTNPVCSDNPGFAYQFTSTTTATTYTAQLQDNQGIPINILATSADIGPHTLTIKGGLLPGGYQHQNLYSSIQSPYIQVSITVADKCLAEFSTFTPMDMMFSYSVNDNRASLILNPMSYSPSYCATGILYSLRLADLNSIPSFMIFHPGNLTIDIQTNNNDDASIYNLLLEGQFDDIQNTIT
ncbi:UNKNOWN [Stylonychia lemnae]|uniref:Uncharacterized protein n=1 Tax=Stylonychia lemnae TaxID=5949 RepID=A0A078A6G2_STYLE|nr:UNKNOWN [Stylonychia lemnae]|eukprot:CDW77461.1 UNKNOWN [Stylonychia lemnae]